MELHSLLFDSGSTLLRTLIIGLLGYVSLVLLLRISGRRTLSKMNAFDLVVTIALGSTLATVLLSKDVTAAQGALAFALLIGVQYLVTWSSVRVAWVRRVVTGEPALLFYEGCYLTRALMKARVTQEEVRAAVRSNGLASLDDVKAVVLETDGRFSVVKQGDGGGASSLDGVKIPGHGEK